MTLVKVIDEERTTPSRTEGDVSRASQKPRPFASRVPFVTALGVLSTALIWSYWSTLATVADRWAHDPRYSHGYFVPLLALALLWSRRSCLAGNRAQPSGWGLPLLGGAALVRLAAAHFYFEWLDALSLLPCLAGLVVLLIGWPGIRWAWPAILFLVFLLPLPYQMEVGLAHPLQRIATLGSTYGLQTLGVSALAEGNVIVVGERRIGVADACSGLGMLVTFFALSTALALLVRRPLADRAVIFLSAIPIGVFTNVVRITATGLLYQTAGPELAGAVFHHLAGWLMMPLAAGLLWLELILLDHLLVAPD
jgi:exosortase